MAVRENRFSQRFSVKTHAELWTSDGKDVLYKGRIINLSTSGLKAVFEKQTIVVLKDIKTKFGLEKARPCFFDSEVVWIKETNAERYVGVRFYFFSSRSRHTRLVSDWSSDVCSSD